MMKFFKKRVRSVEDQEAIQADLPSSELPLPAEATSTTEPDANSTADTSETALTSIVEATPSPDVASEQPVVDAVESVGGPVGKVSALSRVKNRLNAVRSASGSESEPTESALPKTPIRVIVGYLPGVGERDALEFSLGVASKHFDQESITYYEVFPYETGFVYELHEGGSGKAFMPEIIRRLHEGEMAFREAKLVALKTGGTPPDESTLQRSFVIPCATRLVQVSKTHEGLTCILLPESTKLLPDYTLLSKESMRPALDKKVGFLMFGAGVFITGFLAMVLAGTFFRAQPFTPVQHEDLPRSFQKTVYGKYLELRDRVGQDQVLKQAVFKNGAWSPAIIKPKVNAGQRITLPLASAPVGAALASGSVGVVPPSVASQQNVVSQPSVAVPQGVTGMARPVPSVINQDTPRDVATEKGLQP